MATTNPEEKSSQSTVEDFHNDGKVGVVVTPTLPLSLQHLSPEELAAFKRKMVRKIDIRLMPLLIILFLLK